MRVFVTGGTGFVGSEVIRQLVAAGHTVRALVRQGSEGKLAVQERVEIRRGDVGDPESLQEVLKGCQTVVHLVGIIREFPSRGITFRRLHVEATVHMLAAAEAQGVERFLHMSANGAHAGAVSDYHRTKWEAEEAVRASSLRWIIFRPSVIFGPQDDFVNMLADMVRRLPVVPVIGDGRYRLSPVAVEDVAVGFARALERSETAGRTFHCCGPDALTYDEILDLVAEALGKGRARKLHVPLPLVTPVVRLLDRFSRFPLTRTQLAMLLEGNACDPAPWSQALEIQPTPLAQGIRRYVR